MGIEQRMSLWNDLVHHSTQLDEACIKAKKDFDVDEQQRNLDIQEMIKIFRGSLSLLLLLRNESELLKALIGHDFLGRFTGLNLRLDQLLRKPNIHLFNRVCMTIWVMRQVIESLVFWIDHQKIKLRPVSLDEYVCKNAPLFKEAFHYVDVTSRVDDVSTVLIFEPIITNFVFNCIINAYKHGSATQVELISGKRAVMATLTIQDNGLGLPVPYKDIISGLGHLMIDKRLNVMGAKLEVEENGGIDGGALFRIIFPTCSQSTEEKEVDLFPQESIEQNTQSFDGIFKTQLEKNPDEKKKDESV